MPLVFHLQCYPPFKQRGKGIVPVAPPRYWTLGPGITSGFLAQGCRQIWKLPLALQQTCDRPCLHQVLAIQHSTWRRYAPSTDVGTEPNRESLACNNAIKWYPISPKFPSIALCYPKAALALFLFPSQALYRYGKAGISQHELYGWLKGRKLLVSKKAQPVQWIEEMWLSCCHEQRCWGMS